MDDAMAPVLSIIPMDQNAPRPVSSLSALIDGFNSTGVFAPHLVQQARDHLKNGIMHALNTNDVPETDFPTLMSAASFLIEEDRLLDSFAVSRATLKRFCDGSALPGPLARLSLIERVDTLIDTLPPLPMAGPSAPKP